MNKDLGPALFEFGGKQYERLDFMLCNPRGLGIVCSHWQPIPSHRHAPILPCVIYMHGNSSSRLEALPQLSLVLSLGATLVTFDFTGSGQSDGDYVSLGFYERDDLQVVIEYLRTSGATSTIALWGRSMGAATAIMHSQRDPSIAGMVLDSAFASLERLAKDLIDKGRSNGLFAPSIIVSIAISFIRSTVLKKAKFDIKLLSPIQHVTSCFIPAMFIAAKDDDFVSPKHSQDMYKLYAGDKNIIIVDGDHNTLRPKFMYDSVSIFFINVLQIPTDWLNPEIYVSTTQVPWSKKKNYKINFEELGMTTERQNGIVKSLHKTLGNVEARENSVEVSTAVAKMSVDDTLKNVWMCEVCTFCNNLIYEYCITCNNKRNK